MREAESLSFLLQKQLEKGGEQDTIETVKKQRRQQNESRNHGSWY